MRKGVLGVRQDPKKQILFSFQVRQGEEWASDSSDEDFVPDEDGSQADIGKNEKRTKEIKKRTSSSTKDTGKRRKNSNTPGISQTSRAMESGWWGQKLPLELLHNILSFAVEDVGAVPLLCRAARTCRLWREASLHPSLWQKVDLSYGYIKSVDSTLVWLSNNRFSQIQHLNLSGWVRANMSAECIQALAKCTTLKSLNLSGCKKLSCSALRQWVEAFTRLSQINLSSTNAEVMSTSSLKCVIDNLSERLTHLDISRNLVMALPSTVLTAVMAKCKNLRVLDISGSLKDYMVLDIEGLQTGCPLLQVLCLTGTPFRPTSATKVQIENSIGFVHLEELCVGIDPGTQTSCVTEQVLHRLCKSSSKLSLFEARWCRNFAAIALASIPSTSVQRIYLSHCTPGRLRVGDLAAALNTWKDSLIELDIAWNTSSSRDIDDVINSLVSSDDSQLLVLDLSGTAVCEEGVRKVLNGCRRLESLDLTSCRGLPRGMKSKYSGDLLQKLKSNLRS